MAIDGVGFDSKETVQVFIDKIKSHIQKRLLVAGMMPTASEKYKGQQILYVGPSTTTLNKGGVYECGEVAGTDPTEYEWTLISANPLEFNSEDFEVENNEVSLATGQKIKTFTQAEWDALTTAEKTALTGQNVVITDDEGTQTFDDIIPSDASSTNKLVTESDADDLRIQGISTGTYNDITTAGHYFVTIGDSDTNKPVAGYNFFLHVYEGQNGMYVRQIAYMAGQDHNETYSRAKYNGSWGSWKKLVTDEWEYNYTGAFSGELSGILRFKRKNGVNYTGIALDDTSTTVGWKTVTIPSLANIPDFTSRVRGYLMGNDGNCYGHFSPGNATTLNIYIAKDSGGDDVGFDLQWYVQIDV